MHSHLPEQHRPSHRTTLLLALTATLLSSPLLSRPEPAQAQTSPCPYQPIQGVCYYGQPGQSPTQRGQAQRGQILLEPLLPQSTWDNTPLPVPRRGLPQLSNQSPTYSQPQGTNYAPLGYSPRQTVPLQTVYIQGDPRRDPYLLSRVRTLAPEAIWDDRLQRIRAGSFRNPANAIALERALRDRGIPAFRQNSNIGGDSGGPDFPASDRAYYVIIPSSQNNLATLTQQLRWQMRQPNLISASTSPRGPHVAIGPYRNRREAHSIESQLHRSGWNNARLFFGRI